MPCTTFCPLYLFQLLQRISGLFPALWTRPFWDTDESNQANSHWSARGDVAAAVVMEEKWAGGEGLLSNHRPGAQGSWWRGRRSREVPIDAHQAPRPHFASALLTLSPERHLYFRLLLFLEPCRKVSSSVGQRERDGGWREQQQQFNRKTGRPLGNKRAGHRRSHPPPA